MTINVQNKFPRMCELTAKLESLDQTSGEIVLRHNLVLGSTEISDEKGQSWLVSLKTAHLKLHPKGIEIDPTNKYGKDIKGPINTTTKNSQETEVKKAGSLDGAIANLSPSANASISLKGQISQVNSKETTETRQESRMVARGDNYWEIKSLNETVLDGTYLDDTQLCNCKLRDRANRSSMIAYAMARQRDLKIEFIPSGGFTGALETVINSTQIAKSKVIDILIAKGLNKSAEDETTSDFSGNIIMSMVEIEIGNLNA